MLTETLLVLSRQLHPVRSVDGGPVQHRKRSPAPGTNQIAGFGLTCALVLYFVVFSMCCCVIITEFVRYNNNNNILWLSCGSPPLQ